MLRRLLWLAASLQLLLLLASSQLPQQVGASSLYQQQQQQGVMVLNASNFNQELIQHRRPFPHIKLLEYYVSFCGVCAKFKATYLELARQLQPWRNVLRPAAIDLGLSNNSPIAHSWAVTVVPSLRLHPPPSAELAERLDRRLSELQARGASKSEGGQLTAPSSQELHAAMCQEYNSSGLMIQALSVANYMGRAQLLKADLKRYIGAYVRRSPPHAIPPTWPDLRPVTEPKLADLLRRHPRQELFLILEPGGGPPPSTATPHSADTPLTAIESGDRADQSSFGLGVLLELSSTAAWKAVRFVRASENRALIEDVIETSERWRRLAGGRQLAEEQVALLKRLMDGSGGGDGGGNDNILLLHIDHSHAPTSELGGHMSMVTGAELANHIDTMGSDKAEGQVERAKRADLKQQTARGRRSLFASPAALFDKMSLEQKVDLLAQYIKHTYLETQEDREFVEAISSQDDPTESSSRVLEKYINSRQTISRSNNEDKQTTTTTTTDVPSNSSSDSSEERNKTTTTTSKPEQQQQQESWLDKVSSALKLAPSSGKAAATTTGTKCDYNDKLKAIRYMLFNEIPRTLFNDKSLAEQQEKLNTLVNLVSVIKTYFPLPDSASVQFIDGVQSYLVKQQFRFNNQQQQQQQQQPKVIFDTRAFKQELKRLESEGKRLPEVLEWSYCVNSGYPCALWRLFHTLTAFEYKKLSQIRQQPPTSMATAAAANRVGGDSQAVVVTTTSLQQPDNNLSPSVEAITMKSTSDGHLSPIGRLVSPPSTTTSLSLTISATPSATLEASSNNNNNNRPPTEADLPAPVVLVMRDYVSTFHSCEECRKHFRQEAAELNFDKIRQQEAASFSLLWLWDVHNRVNKRIAMDSAATVATPPKVWFPSFEQCSTCYNRPPSFHGKSVDQITMFQESIDWNKQEVLHYLLQEYTRHPLHDNYSNLFGYQVPYGCGYLLIASIVCLILIVTLRCATSYIERQRRHKATLLNGNGNGAYSLALQ